MVYGFEAHIPVSGNPCISMLDGMRSYGQRAVHAIWQAGKERDWGDAEGEAARQKDSKRERERESFSAQAGQ